MGNASGAAGAALAGIVAADPTTPGGLIPPCPSRHFLGILCPGCGSTRALYHLAHGDLPAALHLDALAVLCLPLLLWWFVAWTGERLTGRPLPRWDRSPRAALVVGIVTVAWLVVRNLPWAPFTALRV